MKLIQLLFIDASNVARLIWNGGSIILSIMTASNINIFNKLFNHHFSFFEQ